MKLRRSLAVVAVLLAVSANVTAEEQQIAPDKRAEIEKLLETTGALQLGQQFSAAMVTQLADTLRSTHANIPQKALDILPDVVNGVIAENLGSLKEAIIKIYDERLTLEDVKGLNEFYSTDLGRKIIKMLPGLLQDSVATGQAWGQTLGPEIAHRIQARFKKENITL